MTEDAPPPKIKINGRFGLPLEIVAETSAVLGRRGSGKTNTGVVVSEGLLKHGQQVVILDPTDVWWGLRSSANGKSKGHDILVIGDPRKPHTDVPLAEHDAEAIADYLVDHQVSAILSLRHLSKAARRRFAAAFAERIYDRKGDPGKDTACLFIIDEASTFVPQQVRGDVARLVGAIESWVRQGRASGIGVMLIDQRAASVNKDVLTQVELMVCHQFTSPQDRKAVEAWIEANDIHDQRKEFMASLASLGLGEAWFWSPAWLKCFKLVQVMLRKTFDSSATPKPGEKRVIPTVSTEFDIDQIKGQLAQTIEQARDNDPAQLRRRIHELETDAKTAQDKSGVAEEAVMEYAMRSVTLAIEERDKQWRSGLNGALQRQLEAVGQQLVDVVDQIQPGEAPSPDISLGIPAKPATATKPGRQPRPAPPAQPGTGGDDVPTGSLVQRILDSIAWWSQAGVSTPTRQQVGFVAKAKPNGGHFSNTVSSMRTGGLIDYPSKGVLALTSKGTAKANWPTQPSTFADLCQRTRSILNGPHQRLFDVVAKHGRPITRETLANEARMTAGRGHFNNTVSRLRSIGVIDYPSQGMIGLSRVFTECALR